LSCSGFWEVYLHAREFIHAILRRELSQNPTTVYFSGHSLGGALATFAALDVSINTVPRVNAWLKHQEKYVVYTF
jgi:predicted lipase